MSNNHKPMRLSAGVPNADDAIIAARAVLSGEESVSDALVLRAIGRAAFMVAVFGEEPEVLVGMALAARDADSFRLLGALNAALVALSMPRVAPLGGEDEELTKAPAESAPAPAPALALAPPGCPEWRGETRRFFGGLPACLGDRVLVRSLYNDPRFAIVVDIDPEQDAPSFREFGLSPKSERTHAAGELRFVESVDKLVPGTWTRLP